MGLLFYENLYMKIQVKKKDPSIEFINRCFIRFQKDKMPATIKDNGVQVLAEMDVAKTRSGALRKCFRGLREHIETFGVSCQIEGYHALLIEELVDAYGLHYKANVRIYLKKL